MNNAILQDQIFRKRRLGMTIGAGIITELIVAIYSAATEYYAYLIQNSFTLQEFIFESLYAGIFPAILAAIITFIFVNLKKDKIASWHTNTVIIALLIIGIFTIFLYFFIGYVFVYLFFILISQ